MEHTQKYFYTEEPIYKEVALKEFNEYIDNYPRKLDKDCCGISDPPLITFNDFELADRWPYSIVAKTWVASDDPNDYWYDPNPTYYVLDNYKECFESKTGNMVDKH